MALRDYYKINIERRYGTGVYELVTCELRLLLPASVRELFDKRLRALFEEFKGAEEK